MSSISIPNPIPDLVKFYEQLDERFGSRVWNPENIEVLDKVARWVDAENKIIRLKREPVPKNVAIRVCRIDQEGLWSAIVQSNKHFNVFRNLAGEPIHLSGKLAQAQRLEDEDKPFLHLDLKAYRHICIDHSTDENNPAMDIKRHSEHRHETMRLCEGNDELWRFFKHRWQTGAVALEGKVWRRDKVDKKISSKSIGENKTEIEYKKRDLVKDLTDSQWRQEERATAQWVSSCSQLQDTIQLHSKGLMDVDKIICFGLGHLDRSNIRNFAQHLAAVTIRDTIQKLQRRKRNDDNINIAILAQDPAYDERCTAILKRELGIRVVKGLQGFVGLTANSFVISMSPSIPVVEMVADLTIGYGGVAGMLCDDFPVSDGVIFAPQYQPDGLFGSEWPTKNLMAYYHRCTTVPFNDTQAILGRRWDEEPKDEVEDDREDDVVFRELFFMFRQ